MVPITATPAPFIPLLGSFCQFHFLKVCIINSMLASSCLSRGPRDVIGARRCLRLPWKHFMDYILRGGDRGHDSPAQWPASEQPRAAINGRPGKCLSWIEACIPARLSASVDNESSEGKGSPRGAHRRWFFEMGAPAPGGRGAWIENVFNITELMRLGEGKDSPRWFPSWLLIPGPLTPQFIKNRQFSFSPPFFFFFLYTSFS